MRRRSSLQRREKGFTFIELMVVIFIIGLAASAVILAIPDEGGSVYAEAERFAARAKAARDNAIIESRPAALRLGPEGYALSVRRAGEWRESGRFEWASGTRVGLAGGEADQARAFVQHHRVAEQAVRRGAAAGRDAGGARSRRGGKYAAEIRERRVLVAQPRQRGREGRVDQVRAQAVADHQHRHAACAHRMYS